MSRVSPAIHWSVRGKASWYRYNGRRPKAQTPAPTGLGLKAQGCRAQRGYPGSARRGLNYPNGVAAARGRSHNPVGVVSLAVACSQGRPGAAQPWALSHNPVGIVDSNVPGVEILALRGLAPRSAAQCLGQVVWVLALSL